MSKRADFWTCMPYQALFRFIILMLVDSNWHL